MKKRYISDTSSIYSTWILYFGPSQMTARTPGIFAHSMVKSFPEIADEHGVMKGIFMITFQQLPKRAD